MEAGLAGSDPLLLTRLMGQLVSLLQTRSSKRQQLYSEWVPLQAHLALLQAHAQFATAGAAVLDGESIQVVQSAQQPHYRCAPCHVPTMSLCTHVQETVEGSCRFWTTDAPAVLTNMCLVRECKLQFAWLHMLYCSSTAVADCSSFCLSVAIEVMANWPSHGCQSEGKRSMS